jgi:hypothetical protein
LAPPRRGVKVMATAVFAVFLRSKHSSNGVDGNDVTTDGIDVIDDVEN